MNIVASVFRPEKEAKVIQIKQEEVELSVFTDGIILYLDSPMESTETVVGLMNY